MNANLMHISNTSQYFLLQCYCLSNSFFKPLEIFKNILLYFTSPHQHQYSSNYILFTLTRAFLGVKYAFAFRQQTFQPRAKPKIQ